jgi:hypothetical protein
MAMLLTASGASLSGVGIKVVEKTEERSEGGRVLGNEGV